MPQRLCLGAWNDAKLCLLLSPLGGPSDLMSHEKLGRDDPTHVKEGPLDCGKLDCFWGAESL